MSFLSVDEMIPNRLYLSARPAASRRSKLEQYGIVGVVNLVGFRNPHPNLVSYYNVDLDDGPGANALPLFDSTLDWIRDQPGPVLVHCSEGKSRSPTFIMAYLMREEDMTLLDSMWHVMSRRFRALPREEFIQNLMDFERRLHGNDDDEEEEEEYEFFQRSDFEVCLVRREALKAGVEVSHEDARRALAESGGDQELALERLVVE